VKSNHALQFFRKKNFKKMTPATDKFNQSIHRVLTNAVYNNVILLDVKDINESTVTAKTFCYNGVY